MRSTAIAGAALLLCAATTGLLSTQGSPAPAEPPLRFASWDEVNVLAHGLLQLGHGLREHVERTRGQLGALERRLSACGAACEEPGAPAASSQVSASPLSRGEAAPETLRNLQVRAMRGGCPSCYCSLSSLEGCGQKGAGVHPRHSDLSCPGVRE